MIEQLKDSFKTFETQLNGASKSSWHQLRKKAMVTLESNGLPKAKDEEYRYTQLGRILDKKFQFTDLSMAGRDSNHGENILFHDADAHHIYINNGIVDKEKIKSLAVNGLIMLTLQEASDKYPKDIDAHLGNHSNNNKDAFTALNTIFSYEGVFIKVEKNALIDKPILLHYSTTKQLKNQHS